MERQQSADELLAELRAEAKLADMDVAEDLAQIHDEEPEPKIRKIWADRYKGFIGVNPDERDSLRIKLEGIVDKTK